MKKLICLLAAFLAGPLVSFATTLTLNNGATFNNIEITRTTPIGIDFICDNSAGWADFRDMPLDEAKSLGYDPMRAARFEKQLQENQGSSMPPDATPDGYDDMNNPGNAPQTQENTCVVNPGDSVPYDLEAPCGGASPQWVVWNGTPYPYNVWHHWYWHHHWVYSNGRYVPAHYYHHQYERHNGRYYPYKHNLQEQPKEPYRTPREEGGEHFERRDGGGIHYGYGGGARAGGGGRR